ncbi:MAG TPA: prefoldin subunit alpha [Nitrososphaerales archaeon]|nr:prefoldin subunit alpha [Nitrososphaerales archaeon]
MSSPQRRSQTGTIFPKEAAIKRDSSQEKLDQLVQEVQILEAYYQEIEGRQQALSAAIIEARAALDALDTLSKSEKTELLVPIGGGTLLPVEAPPLQKLVLSVGAGVAVEKDVTAAKSFLTIRMQEQEKGLTALELQRKEIGSRLQAQRNALQKLAQ